MATRKKVFVDVTPTLVNPDGSRTELGMVRYEIEIDPPMNGQFYPYHTVTSSRIALDGTGWGGLEFAAIVRDADRPQPQIIDAVSAYPKLEANASYGPPHAEMARPHPYV